MINMVKNQNGPDTDCVTFTLLNLLHFTNEVIRLESDVIQFPAAFDALH